MSSTPLPELWPTIDETRAAVRQARQAGRRVAFVPTMGALHEGHAELIRVARLLAETVIVSIFVNPTQFGPNEDYDKYPRTLDADRFVCGNAGATGIFAPSVREMYPERSVTTVEVHELDQVLCGPSRPGHFRGVCTVVAKLFNIVQPDVGVFGQKDAQQLLIIRQMVRDLNFPIEIVSVPTVRETDGLAMSSRNRYLSVEERAVAPRIYAALREIESQVQAGQRDVIELEHLLFQQLNQIPGARVDYVRILDDTTLSPITTIVSPALAAVAVFLGSTRLIDNIILDPQAKPRS